MTLTFTPEVHVAGVPAELLNEFIARTSNYITYGSDASLADVQVSLGRIEGLLVENARPDCPGILSFPSTGFDPLTAPLAMFPR